MVTADMAPKFWANVQACDGNGCTVWVGYVSKAGRPIFNFKNKHISAQRVAWSLAHGEPGKTVPVYPTCGNPMCVRVEHLAAGKTEAMARRAESVRVDLAGRTVGKWTVLSYDTGAQGWLCRCSCGTERVVPARRLKNGLSLSCGCLRLDLLDKRDWTSAFWQSVTKTDGGCWEWSKARSAAGYGVCRKARYGHGYAHRAAWHMTRGPIPDRMLVCHRCDNPPCVNPDHLFLGTDADNMRDKGAKGRQPRGSQMPWARLTEQDVSEIKGLFGTVSNREIAGRYGVSVQAIDSIFYGKNWRHVNDPLVTSGTVLP